MHDVEFNTCTIYTLLDVQLCLIASLYIVFLSGMQILMNVTMVHMAVANTATTPLVPISAVVIVVMFLKKMDSHASVS